jgi:hypothetical protein
MEFGDRGMLKFLHRSMNCGKCKEINGRNIEITIITKIVEIRAQ